MAFGGEHDQSSGATVTFDGLGKSLALNGKGSRIVVVLP